ncbi:MAG: cation transporter [Erythrobacter sp.]|nr:cation transporter [Erythrobacter sp.]
MNKTILIGIAAVALTGGGVALALGNNSADRPVVADAAQAQTTFAIENMTCVLCPITVKKAMEGVAGVRTVEVDFDTKTARASYDPKRTSSAAIAAASTNAGYPAQAI